MKLKSLALALAIACPLVAPSFGAVLISIDITGANSPVDSGSPRIWNFTVIQAIEVSRSVFSVKAGSKTTATIIFDLYDDFGGEGNIIRSYTLSAADAGSSYNPPSIFDFGNITLNPGSYSATLTSATDTSGAFQYFMKNGALKLYNDNGSATPTIDSTTALSSSFYTTDGNTTGTSTPGTAVPEPSSLSVITLTGLLALRRRRA
ncbi:hypothetical protein HQ447_10875 [bacterium]|nr:hypothetical protein [bacterium]